MNDEIEVLDEEKRWRARDVQYWRGRWDRLCELIPEFEVCDFTAGADAPANPYLKTVVRKPRTPFEQRLPVGTVSPGYSLAQHRQVIERCLDGIASQDLDSSEFQCELGLSSLGEWMNFRIYFPDRFNYCDSSGEVTALRLEIFNSVEGSSRLVILFGWLKFICSNGMVIGQTKAELRDVHDQMLNLGVIPRLISEGLRLVEQDRQRLTRWETQEIDLNEIKGWADGRLSDVWGKKAACRIFHICRSGCDVDFADAFAPGPASQKPVKQIREVPGATIPVRTAYDVSQALSWVASARPDPDERVAWQAMIPSLLESLPKRKPASGNSRALV